MQVMTLSVVVGMPFARVLELLPALPEATSLMATFEHAGDVERAVDVPTQTARWPVTDGSGRAGSVLVQSAGAGLTRVEVNLDGMAGVSGGGRVTNQHGQVEQDAPDARQVEDEVRRRLAELKVVLETGLLTQREERVVLDLSDADDLDYLAGLRDAAPRTLICLRRDTASVPSWLESVTEDLSRSCSVVVITLPPRGSGFVDCRGETHPVPDPDVAAAVLGVTSGSLDIRGPGYHQVPIEDLAARVLADAGPGPRR